MALRGYLAGLVVLLLSVAAAEATLRLLLEPSDWCFATFLGQELPPCTLHSPYALPDELPRNQLVQGVVVDGQKITVGDLWGLARYDPVTGYAPQENFRSVNGWWVTDEHGARIERASFTRSETSTERILVFGDSFAVGSRVPYKESWSFQLQQHSSDISVLNLAADGYSMAQAYLRYLSVRESLDHDIVLLMFVPEVDLWRDVNVRRDIGGGWPVYWVMPRFAFLGGSLQLVRSPFQWGSGPDSDLHPEQTDRLLRAHLRKFDRWFVEWRYQPLPLLDQMGIAKLAATAYHTVWRKLYRDNLMDPDSEAVTVSAAIFQAMAADVTSSERRFVLAILPTTNELIHKASPDYWRRWRRLVEAVCDAQLSCIDLSIGLREMSAAEVDSGYDGTHFGPVVNQRISFLVRDYLNRTIPTGN